MRWSVKIARVAGTEVRIHITFLLFLAWIGFSYYYVGGAAAAIPGVLFVLALFGCVLLHEFGHALAARAFGIPTPDITLLPIGGVARLQRMPDKPWQELIVAIAGPLVNVIIAVLLMLFLGQPAIIENLEQVEHPGVGAQQEAAMAQMKDLSLNLPVSEAMVTHLVRLPPEATLEDAVEALLRTSQHEFPVVDADDRILGVLTRDRLIAALKQRGSTVAVADVMQRDLPVVAADDPFDKAFQLMQESAFPALPVVDRFGRLRGLITPENVGELMMVNSLLPKGGKPSWRGSPS